MPSTRRTRLLVISAVVGLVVGLGAGLLKQTRVAGDDKREDGNRDILSSPPAAAPATKHGDNMPNSTPKLRGVTLPLKERDPRYEGEVPEPVAFKRISAGEKIRFEDFFASEGRHPEWAPAMEWNLKTEVLNTEILDSYPKARLEVECRTSTCKISVSYPASFHAALYDEALPEERRGLLAQLVKATPGRGFTNLFPEGHVMGDEAQEALVVVFSDTEIDPNEHVRWCDWGKYVNDSLAAGDRQWQPFPRRSPRSHP